MAMQSERQELAKQFEGDLLQMRQCLTNAGYDATEDELIQAWSTYSESLCAGWLAMPEEQHLLGILLRWLPKTEPKSVSQRRHLLATFEASGDTVVRLPRDLLEELGWTHEEELQASTTREGALLIERRPKS